MLRLQVYLLVYLISFRVVKSEKDTKLSDKDKSTPTDDENLNEESIVFLEEPSERYYLIKNKPVYIKCSALNAQFMNMKCVGQWLHPQINKTPTKYKHQQKNEPEIDSPTGNDFENTTKNGEVSRIVVKITKDDLKDYVDPKGYWCECYAWNPPQNGTKPVLVASSRGTVHNAYMRRYFEREPLSTSVRLGNTVQLECLPPAGNPVPEVLWMKGKSLIDSHTDDNFIISNEGNLIIAQARHTDADNYTCVAENVAFRLHSDQARVVVYEEEEWSGWSECSNRCSQSRTKKCTQKIPVQTGMYCVKDWVEWRLCGDTDGFEENIEKVLQEKRVEKRDIIPENKEKHLCPANLWSVWSTWSSCSINCIQHKKRYCNNGNQNNNIDEDTKLNKGIKNIERADGLPIKNIYDLNVGFNKNNIYYKITNFTNYCADYELVMRNCTNDSCLIVSNNQSEMIKTIIIIIIIISLIFFSSFIFFFSYRLFSNKSNLWNKDLYEKSRCIDLGLNVPDSKIGSTTPLTDNKTDSQWQNSLNEFSSNIIYSNFKTKSMKNFKNNEKYDATNCEKSSFDSYKQKIKSRMLKKLMKPKENYFEKKETKQLKVYLANNQNCNHSIFINSSASADNEINKFKCNNFLNNGATNLINTNYFSTSNFNKTNNFDEVTVSKRIGIAGGIIDYDNLGVSITIPAGALTEDKLIFSSISRINRPNLKSTQTLLSSVVVCAFEDDEAFLLKPALIKLRHNASCVYNKQWLFTLFKFNQSDVVESCHLETTSFSLDESYCYVKDQVLSGYALIGQPICLENITQEADIIKNRHTANTLGSSNKLSVSGGALFDVRRNKDDNKGKSDSKEKKKDVFCELNSFNNNSDEHKKVENLSDNKISKVLLIAAFFPEQVNSEEINFKIYLLDDNLSSFEFACEMEKKEGYKVLGQAHKYQLYFQRGGDVRVSLSDLSPHWSTRVPQQEIPFGHLWNNYQTDIHCSFSLKFNYQKNDSQKLKQEYEKLTFGQPHKPLHHESPQHHNRFGTNLFSRLLTSESCGFSCNVFVDQKHVSESSEKIPIKDVDCVSDCSETSFYEEETNHHFNNTYEIILGNHNNGDTIDCEKKQENIYNVVCDNIRV